MECKLLAGRERPPPEPVRAERWEYVACAQGSAYLGGCSAWLSRVVRNCSTTSVCSTVGRFTAASQPTSGLAAPSGQHQKPPTKNTSSGPKQCQRTDFLGNHGFPVTREGSTHPADDKRYASYVLNGRFSS